MLKGRTVVPIDLEMIESVLLVDDDQQIVKTLPGLLECAGYKVEVFRHSLDALLVFFSTPSRFDLVILDESMEDLPGSALARKLLNLRPDLPVILLAGSRGRDGKGAGPGMDTVGIGWSLTKPVAEAVLVEAVRYGLQQARIWGVGK